MANGAKLAGWTALVTGASSGIGRDVARLLAADGCRVVLTARREKELAILAAEIAASGGRADVIAADLAAPGAPEALAREIERRGAAVDILINNAGFGAFGEFDAQPPAASAAMIQVNVAALTALTHALLPAMRARGRGRIMNVASTAAFQAGPLMAVYYATKAYVLSFSEAVAHETAGTGITVTCLCPGPTATEFNAVAGVCDEKLRKTGWMMTSERVALAGYRGMLRGRRVVVPGIINKLLAQSTRIAPRRLAGAIVHWMQIQARGAPPRRSP